MVAVFNTRWSNLALADLPPVCGCNILSEASRS